MSRASVKAEQAAKPETVEQEQEKKEDVTETEQAETVQAAKPDGKTYTVKVKGNPDYCGRGAGGVQFANGKAQGVGARMAAWFKEHPGYEVKED